MGRASEKFDRQLFTLKLAELLRQMQIRSEAAFQGASGPAKLGGSVLSRSVDGQLTLLGELLEGVDRICREVWQTQGEAITPDFVREILGPEAIRTIGTRVDVINECVGNIAARTHEDPHDVRDCLTMKVNRLKAEVANRYKIEARELEYRNAPTGARPLAQSDSWKDFHDRFIDLAREEQGRKVVVTKGAALRRIDPLVRASCSYREHPEGWERGKPEQGLICLLDTPPHGVWNYSDGVNENFLERARLCVAEAGRALPDYPKGTDAEDFWLHRLWLDLRENNSDQLFAASKEDGMIVSVCVASATFCSRLERKAITAADRLRTGEKQTESPRVQNNGKSTQDVDMISASSKAEAAEPEVQQAESSLAAPKSWDEIEVAFLSDERVEICSGTTRQNCNYGELGFEDRRNGKPNRAWVTLREIAGQNGAMPKPLPGKDRAMIQKRIEEIREKLRGHFKIEADPIPFNGSMYQASFKISRRPCSDT